MRFSSAGLALSLMVLAACQPRVNPSNSAPRIPVSSRMASQNVQAQGSAIDDSDLSGGFRPLVGNRLASETIARENGVQLFQTQTRQTQPRSEAQPLQTGALTVAGRLTFTDRKGEVRPLPLAKVTLHTGSGNGRVVGTAETRPDGQWEIDVPTQGVYNVRYQLENRYWKIRGYAWQGPTQQVSAPVHVGTTALSAGTENAKAAWIHDVFVESMNLFARENVPLDWWKRQITTVWPGRGDYYTNYTVNMTGAEQWDVNGHEIGHAIYHQALNAASRGGRHKIDDCYHETLALSEGFATFFSGAVHLQKNDPDARFDQYLVPRRAPIRIENVPEDVCAGAGNEWRVASVFWDVYDYHVDGGEKLGVGLKTIFAALGRQDRPTARGIGDAYARLKEALPASEHIALQQIFSYNTMQVD